MVGVRGTSDGVWLRCVAWPDIVATMAWLAFTERCDSGYRFPIGGPIYRFCTGILVVQCNIKYLIMSDVLWLELHSCSLPLSHPATATT